MGPSFTGPIHEIAVDISKFRLRLSTLARSHPLRPFLVYRLALQLFERYSLLNQKDDIDKTILYLTESLLLSPLSWLAHGLMIVEALFSLAHSLLERSNLSEEPEDAIYAAIYFRLPLFARPGTDTVRHVPASASHRIACENVGNADSVGS